MMKIKFFAMLLLGVFGFSSAQQSDYRSFATFGLVSSFVNQRWNIGFMQGISERIWLGADAAYGAKGIVIPPKQDVVSYKAWEVRPAVYYSLAPDSKLKHFVGVDLFHLDMQQREDFFNFWEDGNHYWADAATMNRKKTGANVTYSILLHRETSRLAFMPKIGFGMRNQNVTYVDVINGNATEPPVDGLPFVSDRLREGTGFNFDLDIKLIYKF